MAGQFWLNNQINESLTWSVEFGGVNVIDHPVHFSHGITPIELISGESSKKITKRTNEVELTIFDTNAYDPRALLKPLLNQ